MKIFPIHFAARIALVYLLFGGLWVLLSDHLLAGLLQDTRILMTVQTYKGWFFVALSALLIYFLLQQAVRQELSTQAELQETSERYRLLFETSLDAIFLTSAEGYILAANPAACRMFGWSEAEICSMKRDDLADLTDPSFALALEGRARSGHFAGDLIFSRKNGEKFPAEVSSALFKDREGRTCHSTIIRDVTQRKQVEQALQASETRFSTIFHASPARTSITRLSDGIFLDVNDGFLDSLGFTREEIIGRTSAGLNNWPNPDEQIQLRETLLTQGSVRNMEARLQRKSGEVMDVLISADIVALSGEPCILSVSVDITERKRAEELKRKSEERYRNLFERMPIALYRSTPNGELLDANQAHARLLGYADRENCLKGNTLEHYANQQDRQRWQAIVEQEGGVQGYEMPMRRQDGTSIWVRHTCQAVRDGENQVIAYEGSLENVTDRKRAEEALRAAHSKLKQVTARLAESQEIERRALSKELHDRVGQSLTALGINLNLLRSRLERDSAEVVAARFDSALELVANITDQVRDVMAELHPQVLDDYGLAAALRWYAERLYKLTGMQVAVQGASFRSNLPMKVSMSLFRIVQEALTNVAKHAGVQNATVKLEELPGKVELSVEDAGAGFQVGPSTPDLDVHLGLITIRERAEALNGSLRVESAPGQGTKLTVSIPR